MTSSFAEVAFAWCCCFILIWFCLVLFILIKLARAALRKYSHRKKRGKGKPKLGGIFLTATLRDFPMSCRSAKLVRGTGICTNWNSSTPIWDRYASGKGSYSHRPEPGRQVTLIAATALDTLKKGGGKISISATRRNLIVENITPKELNAFVGCEIHIGPTALLFAHRRTVPCMALERRLRSPNLMENMWDCAGISCEILESGVVKVGDQVCKGEQTPSRIRTPMAPHMFVRPSLREKFPAER